jgi:hypothetical protein
MSAPKNPGRVQRCSVCGRELTPLDAFNYKTVRQAAQDMLDAIDEVEHGNPDTAWHTIGVLQSKAHFLVARAEKRCGGCELDRLRAAEREAGK